VFQVQSILPGTQEVTSSLELRNSASQGQIMDVTVLPCSRFWIGLSYRTPDLGRDCLIVFQVQSNLSGSQEVTSRLEFSAVEVPR